MASILKCVVINELFINSRCQEQSQKKIRWMHFIPPDTCCVAQPQEQHLPSPEEGGLGKLTNKIGSNKENQIPLFLGADVLNCCLQPTKHQYRTHNRFAKKGLATKVNWEGVHLAGINNCSQVWFYSVQGVFEAVFELGSRELQHQIITKLQDVWLERYLDDHLSENITISHVPAETPRRTATETYSIDNVLSGIQQIITEAKCTVSPQEGEDGCLLEQLELLINVYKQNISGLKRYPRNPLISLYNRYASRLCNEDELEEHENSYNIPKEDHMLLCVVAEWLGNTFYKLQETIDQSIESFKARHITSLNQLPPPRDIIMEVFPMFMNVLVYTWMTGKSCGYSAGHLADHSYTVGNGGDTDRVVNGGDNRDVWQFVQLILEFTNNTLLSGVAHVVYSRLVQNEAHA